MRHLAFVLICSTALFAACSDSDRETDTPTSPSPQPTCTYSLSNTTFSMSGAGGTATFAVNTGTGCAWSVTNNASFVSITSGTSGSGTGTVSFSVGENPGDTRTGTLTVAGQTITISQAQNDPLFGPWGGTIVKGGGCPASLPASVEWSGTFRRASAVSTELVISVASVGVLNQVLPVTFTDNNIQFFVPIDTLYTFNATLSGDRRSLSGTFAGGSCSGTWSGTWSGTRR